MRKPEFVLVERLTLAQIADLKLQFERFANMLASGCYLYEQGSILEVPR